MPSARRSGCSGRAATCIGTFDEHAQQLDAGVNWNFGGNQELRVKMQALGLECGPAPGLARRCRTARRCATNDPIDDFSLSNLGFQVRYRWEFKPLSYLYVVYGRGGDLFNEFAADQTRDALADAFTCATANSWW